jgi:RHS repeat-associated protein
MNEKNRRKIVPAAIGSTQIINPKRWTILIACILLGITASFAQLPDRGFQEANSYASNGINAVNLSNGNMLLNFPIASLPAGPGTSPGYQINLQYNSKLWDSEQTSHDNGTPDETGNDNYQTTALVPSDTGGWQLNSQYLLRVTNRSNVIAPDPCWLNDPVEHIAFRWKVEMAMPDGSIKQFHPETAHSYFVGMGTDGYANIDPNGKIYMAAKEIDQYTHLCVVNEYFGQATTAGMNYVTMDGSHLRLFIPYAPSVYTPLRSWTLYFPNGTVVQNAPPENTDVFQRITDRNGNYIEVIANKIIDQVGRYIELITDTGTGEWIIRVKGVRGEAVDTRIKWTDRWVNKAYTLTRDPRAPYPHTVNISQAFSVVEKITFPTQLGDQSMTFEYYGDATQPSENDYTEGWGEMKEITLPTGAKNTFEYNQDDDIASGILERYATRKNLDYHEQYDGASTGKTESWLYYVSRLANGVVNPSGASSGDVLFYNPNTSHWDSGIAYKSINSDGSIVERLWAYNLPYSIPETQPTTPGRFAGVGSANAYVKAEFTTLPDLTGGVTASSPTAIKEYKYDKNGNVLEIKEYDWVNYSSVPHNGNQVSGLPSSGLTLKRRTLNTYYNQAADADSTTANQYSYHDPSSPKLKNVIKSTEVRDGGNAVKARKEFYYDDPNTTGNLTETRTWDSTKGSVSDPLTTGPSGNSVSTTTTYYYPYGAPKVITDANGVQTKITYGNVSGPNGTVTDLYPTQTESAYGTSIQRTSTAEYDFYTGLVTTSTDADNQVSTVTEYDTLGRPTKVKTAAGTPLESWVRTEYNDLERRVIVRADLETVGDGKKVVVQHYDELGRVRLTRTLEDAAAEDPADETDGIKVQTRFTNDDGLHPQTSNGSYSLTSNPYRAATSSAAAAEETMGWTVGYSTKTGLTSTVKTFAGVSLPAPWGSNAATTGTITTERDANSATVTDQAGKLRRSITNALGHLVRADEPNDSNQLGSVTSPNQPTSYGYDTLDNLTTVTQTDGGNTQTRTFNYSSLARLLSASSPESGTTSYVYDNNGNVMQKTDARSVITAYTYDALSRPTQRTYSGESGYTTPAVTYTYDNLTNAKGKLTKVVTGSVSSPFSVTEYQAFDVLGRITQSRQTTDGTAYEPMTYTYSLSGALIEEKYPSGRVVKNILDDNGDLSMVQSKKNSNAGYWNYAENFTYNPAGAITSVQLGNGHWESTKFNSRLQPTQIALGLTGGATNLLKLDYSYGTTQNSGNIQSQTITVPAAGGANGFTAVQSYALDSLNRLKDATEMVGSTQSWRQSFLYDRYGNRTFDETNTTTLTKLCGGASPAMCAADRKVENPAIQKSDNRIKTDQDGDTVADYTFNTVGSMTKDPTGMTFIYDGENKQVEAKNASSVTIGQYWYDGDGKRVKKYVPATGEITIFVYDAAGKLVAEYSTVPAEAPEVAYTTSDNLGSPRINTGAYGHIIARHDYHPFGEEIDAAASPQRTEVLRYTTDEIRKKFTGYERDGETGLDFAQARYYQNVQGRFQSPDPLLSSTNPDLPQTWNRYSYVVNNPIILMDPTGGYICASKKEKECSQIEAALQKDRDNLENLKTIYGETSGEYIKASKAIASYGAAGVKNGVSIRVKNGAGAGRARTLETVGRKTSDNPTGHTTIVSLNVSTLSSEDLDLVLAHEGSHVVDGVEWVASGFSDSKNPTFRQTESDAYTMSSLFAEASGRKELTYDENAKGRHYWIPKDTIWSKSWARVDVATKRKEGIDGILNYNNLYNYRLNQQSLGSKKQKK